MATKVKIISDPVKDSKGNSISFQVEAWDDVVIVDPVSIEVIAGHHWFDSKDKFLSNLRRYVESKLRDHLRQQKENDKATAGLQIVKDNMGVEINLSSIDLGIDLEVA